ncbi:MAG: transglutaminase-like domain-containing protein [Clostridiales Family XIII bacterium]|nr:transglutaminase-like domain-containing protein [Clostridiales Family XIII bacterium]
MLALLTALSACGSDDGGSGGAGALDTIKAKIGAAVGGGGIHSTVKDDENAPNRDNTPIVAVNEAAGTKTFDGNGATVDYSNINDGYIMAKYDGDNPKIKVQITNTDKGDDTYTYDLDPNSGYQALPLTQGSGSYKVAVYTNIQGDKYAVAAEKQVKMKLKDRFSPYLRPSQYVNYVDSSKCVAKTPEVTDGTKSDLAAAEQIFLFVVGHVSYDHEKAATVQSGYLPDVDETLDTGMGICFDFASLTAAMLRSQGIPCKLIVGYAGSAYHAWVAIYSRQSGEFAAIIEFKGDKYNMADPTFAAAGDKADPNVVGDGTNYQPIYYY